MRFCEPRPTGVVCSRRTAAALLPLLTLPSLPAPLSADDSELPLASAIFSAGDPRFLRETFVRLKLLEATHAQTDDETHAIAPSVDSRMPAPEPAFDDIRYLGVKSVKCGTLGAVSYTHLTLPTNREV